MFYHLHQNLERNSCDVSASLRALDDVHRMSGGSTDNLGGNLRIIVKDLYDIVEIFDNYPEISTEIICASTRHPMHIIECAKAGADIATVPFKVLMQMVKHPLTDAGIEKFKADYEAVFGK